MAEPGNFDTIIIIPARGGSKGVIRKNLRIINGQPLIAYAINTAQQTALADMVIVSTEDDEIESVSKNLGVEVIKRPEVLAGDEVSLPDVIQHAKRELEGRGVCSFRLISLQPTGPMISAESLTKAIQLHEMTNCDSVVSIAEITHGHPYWVKTFDYETHKICNLLDVDERKYLQRQDLPSCFMYTGGFYIRKAEILEKTEGFCLGDDIRGYLLPAEEAVDINAESDLAYFEYLVSKYKR